MNPVVLVGVKLSVGVECSYDFFPIVQVQYPASGCVCRSRCVQRLRRVAHLKAQLEHRVQRRGIPGGRRFGIPADEQQVY